MEFPRRLHVEKRWLPVFLGTLLVTFMAKGGAFSPAYSTDDYRLMFNDKILSTSGLYGRFGEWALVELLRLLQIDPRHMHFFFVAVALVTLGALGTAVARHWRVTNRWLAVAVAALVANHPFTVEIFTFRSGLGTALLPLAALALILIPSRWSPRDLTVGVILFAVALSIYQTILQYALMTALCGAAITLTRMLVASRRRRRLPSLTPSLDDRAGGPLVCAILGTVLYMVVTAFLIWPSRAKSTVAPIGWSELPHRFAEVARSLQYRFLEANPMLHWPVIRLQEVILLIVAGGLLWRALAGRKPRRYSLLLSVGVLALLAAALLWHAGMTAFSRYFWWSPRAMSHSGVFWAGILVVGYRLLRGWARSALVGLFAVLTFSYVGINNHVLEDQARLNLRDALKASRIIARLESLPGFSQADQLAVEGNNWSYAEGYQTSDQDMNISAFGPDSGKFYIMLEMSGYLLRIPDDPQVGKLYCATAPRWPAEGSIAVRDKVAIVCFGS